MNNIKIEMTHKAIPKLIYDGDSITSIDIKTGFHTRRTNIRIRLADIDTPELRGGTPESKILAKYARDFLRSMILNKEIVVVTKDGKTDPFGRYIGTIYTLDGVNINQLMVDEGYAIPYNERPWTQLKVIDSLNRISNKK